VRLVGGGLYWLYSPVTGQCRRLQLVSFSISGYAVIRPLNQVKKQRVDQCSVGPTHRFKVHLVCRRRVLLHCSFRFKETVLAVAATRKMSA
jgi:hypothetical protein